MTTAAMQQPSSASISLPPISTIDFHSHQAHHNPPEVLQPPQPPRQLPPLTHQHYYNTARLPQEPQYVQQRPMYANMPGAPSYHPMVGGRMQLPSTADPNMMMTPARVSKQKDVKRRTKTGCLTCRKRRIKCDEHRPECRNCQKSKRACQGYDPAYLNQSPQNLAPSQQAPQQQSNSTNGQTPGTSTPTPQSQHYHTASPSALDSHHHTSMPASNPHDFVFSKPPEPLATLNQPYRMENSDGLHNYPSAGRRDFRDHNAIQSYSF